MALHVPFDEDTLREVLFGDKRAEVPLQTVMNEILQAEMTEHLGAGNLRFPSLESRPTSAVGIETVRTSGS